MGFRLPVPGQGPACGHQRWCSCRPPGRKGWVSHLDRRRSLAAENGCRENDLWLNTDTGSPTWSKCLGVTNANKAVVINFSLRKGKKKQAEDQPQPFPSALKGSPATYVDGGVLVQLVLGGDAEACAVAAGSPGQVHRGFQLVTHLLIDGAAEFSSIVA